MNLLTHTTLKDGMDNITYDKTGEQFAYLDISNKYIVLCAITTVAAGFFTAFALDGVNHHFLIWALMTFIPGIIFCFLDINNIKLLNYENINSKLRKGYLLSVLCFPIYLIYRLKVTKAGVRETYLSFVALVIALFAPK